MKRVPMSVDSPSLAHAHWPVEAIAAPLDAFCISPDLLQDDTLHQTLVQKAISQGLVPLISPSGHLEGVLTDFALLSRGALQPSIKIPHSEAIHNLPFAQMIDTRKPESLEGLTEAHPKTHFDVTHLLQEARRSMMSLRMGQTVQDAQAVLYNTQYSFVPIVDDDGRYTGMAASRAKLLVILAEGVQWPKVGGMATPLGVYLTTGQLSAGAPWQGLLVMGALFGTAMVAIDWLFPVFFSAVYAFAPSISLLTKPYSDLLYVALEYLFSIVLLLSLIRFTPISGLHAAEHMTVNTIDAGLPLTKENVSRQSRIHRRCGTNIAVMLSLVMLSLICLDTLHNYVSIWGELLYLAVLGTLLWHFGNPVGHWIQENWTTKPPTPAQLNNALTAGQALLSKYQKQPHAKVLWYHRIWASGMPLLLIGALSVTWIADALANVLK